MWIFNEWVNECPKIANVMNVRMTWIQFILSMMRMTTRYMYLYLFTSDWLRRIHITENRLLTNLSLAIYHQLQLMSPLKLGHYKALWPRIISDHTDPYFIYKLLHNHDRKYPVQSSGQGKMTASFLIHLPHILKCFHIYSQQHQHLRALFQDRKINIIMLLGPKSTLKSFIPRSN